jgi:hypothetical protein
MAESGDRVAEWRMDGARAAAIVPHGRATRPAKQLDGHVFHGLLQYRINTESVAVY